MGTMDSGISINDATGFWFNFIYSDNPGSGLFAGSGGPVDRERRRTGVKSRDVVTNRIKPSDISK